MCLLAFVAACIYVLIRRRADRPATLIIMTAICIGGLVVASRGMPDFRLVNTAQSAAVMLGEGKTDAAQMNSLSTGRTGLAFTATAEVLASPIVGNGFSGYGRFGKAGTPPTRKRTHQPTSTI